MQTLQEKNYKKLLFLIIIAAIAIRLLGIFQPINEDELHWTYSTVERDWLGTIMRNAPLSIYATNTVSAIFGTQTWAIRLTFVLAGIATILLSAKLAKKQYGKKTALITAGLLAIHPLHILASLQEAYEGSFLTLFLVTTIYCLYEYHQSNKKKWLYLLGISFGLALLSKTSAIFIIPPIILIYLLLKTKKIHAILDTIKATTIGIAVFIFGFAIPSIILKSPALINTITQLASQTQLTRESILPLVIQYAHAIIWIGPIFTVIPLYLIISKKADLLNSTVIIWTALFYFVAIQENAPPIERYYMILLPFLAILAANFITCEILKNKKIQKWILASSGTSLAILLLINAQKSKILPFYPKTEYINNILNLNWNLLLPITGSSGPIGFYVNFTSIAFAFITTIAIFALIVLLKKVANSKKNTNTISILLIIFTGIGLAYQLFLAQEHLLSTTQPNINKITQEVIDYANTNTLKTPVYYFKNYALFYNFEKKYNTTPAALPLEEFNYFDIKEYNTTKLSELRKLVSAQPFKKEFIPISFGDDNTKKIYNIEKEIAKQGATIIFIDFPTISKTGALWQMTNKCTKKTMFQDKNTTIGYIFECPKPSKNKQ